MGGTAIAALREIERWNVICKNNNRHSTVKSFNSEIVNMLFLVFCIFVQLMLHYSRWCVNLKLF
jgi:hypothetical protein